MPAEINEIFVNALADGFIGCIRNEASNHAKTTYSVTSFITTITKMSIQTTASSGEIKRVSDNSISPNSTKEVISNHTDYSSAAQTIFFKRQTQTIPPKGTVGTVFFIISGK